MPRGIRPGCFVRMMTTEHKAYVGAMIEAEGSVNKPVNRPYWQIHVVNTDLEIISALIRATGVGSISYKTTFTNKPCWLWSVQAKNDVDSIAIQCANYSTKLQKVGQ